MSDEITIMPAAEVGIAPAIGGKTGNGTVGTSFTAKYDLGGIPTPAVAATGGSLPEGLTIDE